MTQAIGTIQPGPSGLSRRQLLAIGWTVAGLIAAGEAGAATLAFMYPRLEAGAFGGKLIIGSRQDALRNLPDAKAKPDATFVNTGRFYLSRTPDGILAQYRKCVHLGCVVPWNEQEDQFHCPCHGSLYNRKGEVLGGPAPRPLDIFSITEEAGSLVVDTGKVIQRKTYEASQVLTIKWSVPQHDKEKIASVTRQFAGTPCVVGSGRLGAGRRRGLFCPGAQPRACAHRSQRDGRGRHAPEERQRL